MASQTQAKRQIQKLNKEIASAKEAKRQYEEAISFISSTFGSTPEEINASILSKREANAALERWLDAEDKLLDKRLGNAPEVLANVESAKQQLADERADFEIKVTARNKKLEEREDSIAKRESALQQQFSEYKGMSRDGYISQLQEQILKLQRRLADKSEKLRKSRQKNNAAFLDNSEDLSGITSASTSTKEEKDNA